MAGMSIADTHTVRNFSKNIPKRFADHTAYHEKHFTNLCREVRLSVVDDGERLLATRKRTHGDDKFAEGDKIFKKIVKMFGSTKGVQLLPYQTRLVRMCLIPALSGIYGNEFDRSRKELLEWHGVPVDDWFAEVFFISSRRMGKTLTLSFICTIFALCIPSDLMHDMQIAVFSVTKVSSRMFIKECVSALRCIPERFLDGFDIEITSENIRFVNKSDNRDVRLIQSYCGRGSVSTRNSILFCRSTIPLHFPSLSLPLLYSRSFIRVCLFIHPFLCMYLCVYVCVYMRGALVYIW